MLEIERLKPLVPPVLAAWAVGCVAFIAAQSLPRTDPLQRIDVRLRQVAALQLAPGGYSNPVADIMAMAIFAPPPAGAAAEASRANDVKLVGVSRTPRRRAALVSVNGAAPIWVELGQSRDDLRVISITGSTARIATAAGERELRLYQIAAPESQPPAPGSAQVATAQQDAPSAPVPSGSAAPQ